MSTIRVQGLQSLKGEIKIQGSKNAALPMIAAAVLHKGTTVLTNVPKILDVFCMMGILEYMGCRCSFKDHELVVDASSLTAVHIPEAYVNSMRSSIIVLGALLGRMGEARTHFPGGCSIGKRPIDLHLTALEQLGAAIREEDHMIEASAPQLYGSDITFLFPSVGATENTLLASVLAEGVTVIHGAAKEPEITELCLFLNNMGAHISGIGTGDLTVEGVKELHDSTYRVAGDRIVAGTYLAAVMAGGGEALLQGIDPSHMDSVLENVQKMGATVLTGGDTIFISSKERPLAVDIRTGPYPAFPTDLQSPMLAVMAIAEGKSRMEETIFEGRFGAALELQKLCADIIIEDNTALICGRKSLTGASVTATDLRGGAALVVAGLVADRMTEILDSYHISRGYEDICRDLSGIGACIRGTE